MNTEQLSVHPLVASVAALALYATFGWLGVRVVRSRTAQPPGLLWIAVVGMTEAALWVTALVLATHGVDGVLAEPHGAFAALGLSAGVGLAAAGAGRFSARLAQSRVVARADRQAQHIRDRELAQAHSDLGLRGWREMRLADRRRQLAALVHPHTTARGMRRRLWPAVWMTLLPVGTLACAGAPPPSVAAAATGTLPAAWLLRPLLVTEHDLEVSVPAGDLARRQVPFAVLLVSVPVVAMTLALFGTAAEGTTLLTGAGLLLVCVSGLSAFEGLAGEPLVLALEDLATERGLADRRAKWAAEVHRGVRSASVILAAIATGLAVWWAAAEQVREGSGNQGALYTALLAAFGASLLSVMAAAWQPARPDARSAAEHVEHWRASPARMWTLLVSLGCFLLGNALQLAGLLLAG